MGRESHRYRGVRRRSAAGWGHRAIYVAAAVATASLVSGFALAGYWFGTFSHVFPQATAQGLEIPPYNVAFVGMGAGNAIDLGFFNFTNSSAGPCVLPGYNGTNNGTLVNDTQYAGNNTANPLVLSNIYAPNTIAVGPANFTDFFCLNAVNNSQITDLWGNWTYNGSSGPGGWQNITAPSNASFANVTYNNTLANITGLNDSALFNNTWENFTGCNPVMNASQEIGNFTNCDFFASNNNTTYLPHAGFWDSATGWVSEDNVSFDHAALWHPNQTGYLASDEVFYASVEFYNVEPNVTYEVDADLQGATPVPEIVYVNTGPTAGANYTLDFVFDETIAWSTWLSGNQTGVNDTNVSGGFGSFHSFVIAQIGTVSMTVSQCTVDNSGLEACPETVVGLV
jgi:hypothetical protein